MSTDTFCSTFNNPHWCLFLYLQQQPLTPLPLPSTMSTDAFSSTFINNTHQSFLPPPSKVHTDILTFTFLLRQVYPPEILSLQSPLSLLPFLYLNFTSIFYLIPGTPLECYHCNSTFDGSVGSLTCKGPSKQCPGEDDYCGYAFMKSTGWHGLTKG